MSVHLPEVIMPFLYPADGRATAVHALGYLYGRTVRHYGIEAARHFLQIGLPPPLHDAHNTGGEINVVQSK